MGKDYRGTMAVDMTGASCNSWSLDVMSESFVDGANFRPTENSNYCRNIPGKNWKTPSCLVYSHRGTFVYRECKIPYCGK